MKSFEKLVLYNWGEIAVKANIDEDMKDIRVGILYQDHGDDFFYIETTDGEEYEYGFYANRLLWPDEGTDAFAKLFIRQPIMYRKHDEHSVVSNHLFFQMFNESYGIARDSCSKPFVVSSYTELRFKWILKEFEKAYDSGVRYHCNNYKNLLAEYLAINGIDTNENLSKLDAVHFDTRVNGVDGIAGKRKLCRLYREGNWLYADDIYVVIANGRYQNKRQYTKTYWINDEWGGEGIKVNLKKLRRCR